MNVPLEKRTNEDLMAADEELRPLAIPVATSDVIPGRENARYVGPVFGVIARSMGFTKGITGSLRAMKRGEVKEFTATLQQARHHAAERMVEQAVAMGANAVVALRYDSGDIGEQQGLAEIVAYGTAVVID
jgi:uncharacterized protein YbjQ (UPF0145 family)